MLISLKIGMPDESSVNLTFYNTDRFSFCINFLCHEILFY
jgi:hypothetical protein